MILLVLAVFAPSLVAEPAWVESINVLFEKQGSAAFQLDLANRFQLAAVESETGNSCVVRLQPAFTGQNAATDYSGNEFLPWQASESLPLNRVNSEWIAGQLWLRFDFNRNVNCRFQISADQQSLWTAVDSPTQQLPEGIEDKFAAARAALAKGDAAAAEVLYREVLRGPPNSLQEKALEYLGVAQERLSKFDEAATSYRLFLERYPQSNGVNRVRQRLAGISLMDVDEVAAAPDKKSAEKASSLRWFGVLSNAYQYYSTDNGGSGSEVLQSAWITDLNLNGRYRSDTYDTRLVVSGGYWKDFEFDTFNPKRLSKAYIDTLYKPAGQQIRIGRQNVSGEGILGRFDGVRYHSDVGDSFGVNLVWGYPVLSSRDVSVNSDAQVYGLSLDLAARQSPWRSNVFVTKQERGNIIEREALGAEVSYQSQRYSWFSYLDYDTGFAELNTALLSANWFGDDESHYYFSADYRRSPMLSVSNALIGQAVTDLNQLEASGISQNDFETIALDRTAISKSLALGASRRFSTHWRWSLDTSFWQLTGTPESFGVPGFDGTDVEGNFSAQLIANDIWKERTISWITLRYSELTRSKLYSLGLETRLPIGQHWRLRPKLQFYQRDYSDLAGSQTSLQPGMRLQYEPTENWTFEFEFSAEQLSSDRGGFQFDRNDYFMYLRADWQF
ncbi:tetratricopeptide repeat protein [Zhongshania sp. BJYM1]|uniref:tetratricopeptide repeat protein n=1 Tax=Zhongshania aquatica TaxID=2965069 RepID=UPI0022B42EA7|nr:tetratricopeptide repeat protein [Marortus sp. BJYM1]